MSITSQAHLTTHNQMGLLKNMFRLLRTCFISAKEKGKDLFKCLMVYHITPLSTSLWSPIQILSSRSGESDFPMSNAVRKELGLGCEDLRNKYKNEHLPSHDLHLDKRPCTKIQLANGGIQLPLQDCVKSPEAK